MSNAEGTEARRHEGTKAGTVDQSPPETDRRACIAEVAGSSPARSISNGAAAAAGRFLDASEAFDRLPSRRRPRRSRRATLMPHVLDLLDTYRRLNRQWHELDGSQAIEDETLDGQVAHAIITANILMESAIKEQVRLRALWAAKTPDSQSPALTSSLPGAR